MSNICVKYSLETEANKLLHDLQQLYSGFYLKNGWYPLPLGTKTKFTDSSVIFPTFDYSKISVFYKNKKLVEDSNQFEGRNTELLELAKSQLSESNLFIKISNAKLKKLEADYTKVLKPSILKLKKSFGYLKGTKLNIQISPTQFGTCGSFNHPYKEDFLTNSDINLVFYLRVGQPADQVKEYLASSLTRGFVNHLEWKCTEAVSDFITEHILDSKTHVPTLDRISKVNKTSLKKSLKFLRTYNLPTGKVLDYFENENKIILLGENITTKFTQYEFRTLRELILKKGTVATFDDLSNCLYKAEIGEKFTFWGITKTIQRIRDKLELLGVPREQIVNVKGQGFKLII